VVGQISRVTGEAKLLSALAGGLTEENTLDASMDGGSQVRQFTHSVVARFGQDWQSVREMGKRLFFLEFLILFPFLPDDLDGWGSWDWIDRRYYDRFLCVLLGFLGFMSDDVTSSHNYLPHLTMKFSFYRRV
jgi:hypothetical protein